MRMYQVSSTGSILLLLLTGIVAKPASGVTWSYDGAQDSVTPPRLQEIYQSCGGASQSPVNLRPKNELLLLQYQPFKGYLIDPDFTLRNIILRNSGQTAEILLPPRKYLLQGGGLEATYYAASLHFHWSSDSSKGSEHVIGSRSYPAEMHIVHHKVDYYNVTTASSVTNDSMALAVLGIFFEVTQKQNSDLAPIIDGIKAMQSRNPSDSPVLTTLPSVQLGSLLNDAIQSGFYRYNGSLTIPACNEQVVWTIFDKPLGFSGDQMSPFRSLVNELGTPMLSNNRPLQPLGARKVFHSDQGWAQAA